MNERDVNLAQEALDVAMGPSLSGARAENRDPPGQEHIDRALDLLTAPQLAPLTGAELAERYGFEPHGMSPHLAAQPAAPEPHYAEQFGIDPAPGYAAPEEPITRAEQEAVLLRFGLVDLLDLVVFSAVRASDKLSMTVESSYPGVRVVVRVTHPRIKKQVKSIAHLALELCTEYGRKPEPMARDREVQRRIHLGLEQQDVDCVSCGAHLTYEEAKEHVSECPGPPGSSPEGEHGSQQDSDPDPSRASELTRLQASPCDECDPSFGCFAHPEHCCKKVSP